MDGKANRGEDMNDNVHSMSLRPHHILCVRFISIEPPGRGEDFDILCRQVREILLSHEGTIIEVTEGVDDLCNPCPNLGDSRCISPFGDEDKVRRWDARIIDGLGLTYGEKKTAGDLRELINQKAPLDFCRNRCPWKTICSVFNLRPDEKDPTRIP
jgi:hypothetical protein